MFLKAASPVEFLLVLLSVVSPLINDMALKTNTSHLLGVPMGVLLGSALGSLNIGCYPKNPHPISESGREIVQSFTMNGRFSPFYIPRVALTKFPCMRGLNLGLVEFVNSWRELYRGERY